MFWNVGENTKDQSALGHMTIMRPHSPTMLIWRLSSKRASFFVRNQITRSQMLATGFRRFEERFAEVLSYISEIKRLCDSRNIGLTIVLIPDEMQVSKPLQTRVIVASGLAPASFDFTLPNKL